MSVLSEEVKKLKKLSLDNLFKADVEDFRYTDIQKLYEAARITNRMMVEKLKNRQSARTSFSSAIFMDAAFLVADSILENDDVKELFYRLYGGRFPDLVQKRNQINNLISRNTPDSLAQAYQIFSKNIPRAGKQRFSFWMFILQGCCKVLESECIQARRSADIDK